MTRKIMTERMENRRNAEVILSIEYDISWKEYIAFTLNSKRVSSKVIAMEHRMDR